MAITKVNNVVTETAPPNGDRTARTDVHAASGFAICDNTDVLKQFKFDASAQAAGKSTTFTAGATAGDVTLTLPATSGTLATTASLGETLQVANGPSTGQTITIAASTTVLLLDGATSDSGAFTIALPSSPTNGQTIKMIASDIASIGAVTFTSGSASRDQAFDTLDFSSKRLAIAVYETANTTWYVGY